MYIVIYIFFSSDKKIFLSSFREKTTSTFD